MVKKYSIVLLLILIIGMCGCISKNNSTSNRQESDADYIVSVQNYIQEKYSVSVEVVETILPGDGFNSALEENILVVRDSEGVTANVRARLSTPYKFFDDYIEACTAALIQKEIDSDILQGSSKVYVVVNNPDINKIDIAPANIDVLTYVAMISEEPSKDNLESLYKIYCEIQQQGYGRINFIVGFTDGSEEFNKAAENYTVHGKSNWKDYSREVYAYLSVNDMELSFDEFKEKINYEVK